MKWRRTNTQLPPSFLSASTARTTITNGNGTMAQRLWPTQFSRAQRIITMKNRIAHSRRRIVRNGFWRKWYALRIRRIEATARVYKLPTNPVKCVGSEDSVGLVVSILSSSFLSAVHSFACNAYAYLRKIISIAVEQRNELVKCFFKCADFSLHPSFCSRSHCDNNWPYPCLWQPPTTNCRRSIPITLLGAP